MVCPNVKKMVSKLALLAVVTVLLGGCTSTSEADDRDECTSKFLDLDSIDETSSMIEAFPDSSLSSGALENPFTDPRADFIHWIFPDINFTCDGTITKWRLRVNSSMESVTGIMQRPSPDVTIWKLDDSDVSRYMLKNITDKSQINVTTVNGFIYYDYIQSPPIPVQAGDFIGIMMPVNADDRALSVKPLFLRLPESNFSIISCATLNHIINGQIFLPERRCLMQHEQLTQYIPLISAIFTTGTTSSTSPFPTTDPPSTPSDTSMASTPPPNSRTAPQDSTTDSTSGLTSTAMDGTVPPQSGANSNQLVGVIVGALVAALSLVLIVILAVFLVLLLTKRRSQKLYDMPVPPQPQNMDNPVYTGAGSAESNGLGKTNVYATPSPTQLESPHPLETNIVAEHYEFSQDVVPASYEQPLYELEPSRGLGPDEPTYPAPEYAQPYVPRNATLTQPYEVPLSALSTLASTRDESSLDRHTYSILEAGLYVPTEEERQSLRRPPTSKSSTSTSNGGVFDEEIYARMSKKYKGRLDESAFFEQEEVYWEPASSQTALYDQLSKKKYREILKQQIQIIKHLGAGQFGTVSKGVWESPYGSQEVAVKMLQPQVSDRDKKVKFLKEAAIMGQFLHPNIVKLHGVVTVNEPVMIVLEYMNKGDLREHLLSQRPKEGDAIPNDLPQRFLKFCREIASGMNYLSNKAFVHRDLAARNILVSEDETCKIGDFGMSRDLEDNSYYITHGGKIPVKWTAPEALHFRKYSTASDVWSFGCVMYEIWSLGHKPFESYSNIQAMQMIGSGYRLPPPPGCPRPLYSLMIRCWHSDASNRPLFSAIFKMLGHLDSDLLSWTEKDKAAHPQAASLGAPLEAGDELYTDLQDYYLDEASKRQ